MAKTNITCISCPIGCELVVDGDGKNLTSVTGAACKRGETYAASEYSHPVRILTTLARVEGAEVPLVPVRSNRPIPKSKQFDCVEAVRAVRLRRPVKAGTVVLADVCGTGADIVATGSVG